MEQEPHKNARYTVMVVPENGPRTEKLVVSDLHVAVLSSLSRMSGKSLRRLMWAGGSLLVVLVGSFAGMAWHSYNVVDRAAENTALREENLELKNHLATIKERVSHINETLIRVKHLNANLQNISRLSDPERKLEIAPELPDLDPREEADALRLADSLEGLEAEARSQEETLRALTGYFEDRQALLASAPAIWPARGWVTSDFGVRLDPFTSERVRHNGLDIAGPVGTPVVAPADGTVIYATYDGGYGNVIVLDHGSGIKTRYAHLSAIKVRTGQRVTRGEQIGALGNTGRSTGPHLHYEVRVNGVPESPRKFILETDEPADPLRGSFYSGRQGRKAGGVGGN